MSDGPQPICDICWREREGIRIPSRVKLPYREHETCCWCGHDTTSGIYLRVDPATVPHPTLANKQASA